MSTCTDLRRSIPVLGLGGLAIVALACGVTTPTSKPAIETGADYQGEITMWRLIQVVHQRSVSGADQWVSFDIELAAAGR